MGYVERTTERPQRPVIEIDGHEYDIDDVGQDDGLDAEKNFRFLLQLGLGYMINLWVVGIGPDGSWFHTFWTKPSVVHSEMEEHGPPAWVTLPPLVLPRLFGACLVGGRRYRLVGTTLEARIDAKHDHIAARMTLADGDALAELVWSSEPLGWRLDGAPVERPTFAEPLVELQ